MRRSYDTMAEAHVELDAGAVIHGGPNNDNDNAADEDEGEDEIHDEDAVEGIADGEEEGTSDDDDDDEEEEEDDNIIVIDDDSDNNNDIIVIDDGSDNDDIILIDDDSDSDDLSSAEDDIPTPDEVEVEYTYPDDFLRPLEWQYEVDAGQYFRLIIDCNNANITEICDKKFQDCKWLIEVVFLNNTDDVINNGNYLRRIGKYAFGYCVNLQRITNGLPLGLVELDDGAFLFCDSLSQEITIPRKVRIVGKLCFRGCCCITSVVFDHLPTDPVVDIRQEAFNACSGLRLATLPPNLLSIPSYCFFGCVLLINILIPIPVRVIEQFAFKRCSALRHIDLSENITEICQNAYADCTSLETITIKSSTVQFGDHVFVLCPSLSTIKVYPWVLPRLFAAMNGRNTDASNFRNKFLRKSQHQLAQFRR